MKIGLVYSSKTGNTKSVAKEIFKELDQASSIFSVEDFDLSSIDDYDFLILGFWVDKGYPDKKALELIKNIKNKNLAYFLTLGAYPDSEHANNVLERTEGLLKEKGNNVYGHFICQGRLAKSLEEQFKKFPKGHPHEMTPERIARHKEASKHPNQEDFKAARLTFRSILEKYKSEVE